MKKYAGGPGVFKEGLVCLWSIFKSLSVPRKREIYWLAVGMGLNASFEVISLGAILPFLALLASAENPEGGPTRYAMSLLAYFDIRVGPSEILYIVGGAFVAAVLASGLLRLLILWRSSHISFHVGADLSVNGFNQLLRRPYRDHTQSNSSQAINGLTRKITVVAAAFQQMLLLIGGFLSSIFVIAALLVLEPVLFLCMMIVLGGTYWAVGRAFRKRIYRNGVLISDSQDRVVQLIQEAMGGIRDIILGHLYPAVAAEYARTETPMRFAQGRNAFFSACPRMVIELLGMVVLILAALIMFSAKAGDATSVLPTLGAIALGLQRLVPSIQAGYSGWAYIVGNYVTLKDVAELAAPIPVDKLSHADPIAVTRGIEFKNVSFAYADRGVLHEVTCSIPVGSRVGIMGVSGSGKSTLLDLLLGLLQPDSGSIEIDGQSLSAKNIPAWQASIAHVPQNIFLGDGTLEQNIALGVPAAEIDYAAMNKAVEIAQLSEFLKRYPDGLQFRVGERGALLSGGERQRVGIARALYKHDCATLVLDEATSALDVATEAALLAMLEAEHKTTTVVMVSHRPDTLRKCGMLIEVSQGQVLSHVGAGAVNARIDAFVPMPEQEVDV